MYDNNLTFYIDSGTKLMPDGSHKGYGSFIDLSGAHVANVIYDKYIIHTDQAALATLLELLIYIRDNCLDIGVDRIYIYTTHNYDYYLLCDSTPSVEQYKLAITRLMNTMRNIFFMRCSGEDLNKYLGK